jgi:uncharacterized protein DUF1566
VYMEYWSLTNKDRLCERSEPRSILCVFLATFLVGGIGQADDSRIFDSVSSDSALEAPKLTITGTTVSLSWTTVAGATGYTLYYAPFPYTGPASVKNIPMGTQTSMSGSLSDGDAFYVAVQANNSVGSSGYSNIEYFNIGTPIYGGCTCSGTLNGTRWCDNGDGTVTDLTTCLVWLQKADWGGVKSWRNSSTDCRSPSYTCYDDVHRRSGILKTGTAGANLNDGSVEGNWRLPTKTERYGLAIGSEAVRSGNMRAFTGVQSSYYWSSSTMAALPVYAHTVGMVNAHEYGDLKDSSHYVWPVRSGN